MKSISFKLWGRTTFHIGELGAFIDGALAHARTAVDGDTGVRERGGGEHESRGRSAVAEIDRPAAGESAPHALEVPVGSVNRAGRTELTECVEQSGGVRGDQGCAQYRASVGEGRQKQCTIGQALRPRGGEFQIEPSGDGLEVEGIALRGWLVDGSLLLAEDRDHVFDGDHEEPVVTFEVHGHPVLGVEEHPVVLLDRIVLVAVDLGADRDHAAGQGRDLHLVGQVDADLGDFLVLILAQKDAHSDRFNDFDGLLAGW